MDEDERTHLTRLIQARVPGDLARAVELAAAKELISIAAYVRRSIAQAVRQATKGNTHG